MENEKVLVKVELIETISGDKKGEIFINVDKEENAQSEVEKLIKACYSGISAKWEVCE